MRDLQVMIKSVYYHVRIYGNLRGWEGRSSHGLAREVFKGVCILFGVRFGGFYGCYAPFPGVSVVFPFFRGVGGGISQYRCDSFNHHRSGMVLECLLIVGQLVSL